MSTGVDGGQRGLEDQHQDNNWPLNSSGSLQLGKHFR